MNKLLNYLSRRSTNLRTSILQNRHTITHSSIPINIGSPSKTLFRCFGFGISPAPQPKKITLNEVKILMIDRDLQEDIFGCVKLEYPSPPKQVLLDFERCGIHIKESNSFPNPIYFNLPHLKGGNVKDHFDTVANDLSKPFSDLFDSFPSVVPPQPNSWSSSPGWTRYVGNSMVNVMVPDEHVLIFDTEVLLEQGDLPTIAVALSPSGWYSWTSPSLFRDDRKNNRNDYDLLIPMLRSGEQQKEKCLIGHFVSYDRARIMEEYNLNTTGLRFLDTMSLHIAVSGLTSTQRHLKTTVDKRLFNNKLWQDFVKDHFEGFTATATKPEEKDSFMELEWLSETSLNSLTDVYRLYCNKDPPQDKTMRSVFESGTKDEVHTRFQDLMKYCATDVTMTFEIFKALWPIFKERFPHPASLYGILEMGSMYLPINDSWNVFQNRAEQAFAANELRQRKLLMQLAEDALARYSNSKDDFKTDPWLWDLDWSKPKMPKKKTEIDEKYSTLPKWYRELIPKPVKQNLDSGPALLTAQMRIAPKLLRLCWQGLPLHYDQVLKWGVLIPGRSPQPYGDPRYYTDKPEDSKLESSITMSLDNSNISMPTENHTESQTHENNQGFRYYIRSNFSVFKKVTAGDTELSFPYSSYLSYWLNEMKRRILKDFEVKDIDKPNVDGIPTCNSVENKTITTTIVGTDDFRTAYLKRLHPDHRDDRLLDEFKRSIEIMPLEQKERSRLAKTIAAIRAFGQKHSQALKKNFQNTNSQQHSTQPVYEKLGELQVRGSAFWQDPSRFQSSSNNSQTSTRSRRKARTSHVVDTVNPVIPTCWFMHLPHESGEGLPVGSPLSRSFQSHIAANRLHCAELVTSSTNESSLANSNGQVSPDLANQLLRDRIHATFWQSYCKRIKSQMCVWLPHHLLPEEVRSDPDYRASANYGAILPQVIASGTISRRAVEPLWLTASNADKNRLGSEIKAMVQAPPGFCFVGADVDSQEMWIAALIGDASVGFQGGTPYGWMTLEGNKSDGTDLHTKIAKQMGITRNEAKVLNYSRLYGSGYEFTTHLLAKFSNISTDQASLKAKQLLRLTKGQRVNTMMKSGDTEYLATVWQGGTESAVFNELESIARSSEPRTPILKAQLTRALNPKLVKDDFLPSRINWVVQSSAVDYLHCMLVFMGWLIKEYKLPARLCISIHDEVRYICRKDAADRVALALQISNLLTRSFFAYQMGMRDLPESVAYFSSVEIDSCLRKDPNDDCVTPSNPEGICQSYGISRGQSLTMRDILERTGGSLAA